VGQIVAAVAPHAPLPCFIAKLGTIFAPVGINTKYAMQISTARGAASIVSASASQYLPSVSAASKKSIEQRISPNHSGDNNMKLLLRPCEV
jgi:hypothetical protein